MARDFYGRDGYGTVQQFEMRIGDPERDVTREHLSWAFSNGYVNRGEFDERTDKVNGAKSAQDLKAIVRDLPARPKIDEVVSVVTKKNKRTVPNVLKIWVGLHPSFKALSFLPLSLTLAIATPVSLLANHPNAPGLVVFAAIAAICVGAATALIEVIAALACVDDF